MCELHSNTTVCQDSYSTFTERYFDRMAPMRIQLYELEGQYGEAAELALKTSRFYRQKGMLAMSANYEIQADSLEQLAPQSPAASIEQPKLVQIGTKIWIPSSEGKRESIIEALQKSLLGKEKKKENWDLIITK